MLLPNDLKSHFPHLTLLALADRMTAKLFLIGGDGIQELDGISEPAEFRQDSEGSFTSYDGSRVAGPDADVDDAPRLKTFVARIAERITDLTDDHDIRHIILVMPAEVDHLLHTRLSEDIRARILHTLHKSVMKEDPLSILRRIYAPVPGTKVPG